MQRNLDGFHGFGDWGPNVAEVRQVDRWRPRRALRAWGEIVGIFEREDVSHDPLMASEWHQRGREMESPTGVRRHFDSGVARDAREA